MPNIKSAKKRVITSAKKHENNHVKVASARTAIKNVEKTINAGNMEDADKKLNIAMKAIDKAANKGLIHKNKAARQKSRLAKMSNNAK